MKKEQLTINNLHAVIWQPDTEAKAVLHITHGMTDTLDAMKNCRSPVCARCCSGRI